MNRWKVLVGGALLVAGCAAGSARPDDLQAGEASAQRATMSDRERMVAMMAVLDFGRPYLAAPVSLANGIIAPPPSNGSHAHMRDRQVNDAALSARDTPRWQMAVRDADLRKGAVLAAFSCAAGVTLSDEATPAIAELLRRSRSDFGASTSAAKKRYARERPFTVNGAPSCTPEAEPFLAQDGSYPSGHAAIGHGTGLVLATLFPDRAGELVARGMAYGHSRAVCNVHWQSDVEAARPLAAVTFARLMADEAFRADLAAARAEAAVLKAVDVPSGCALETTAAG